MVGNFQDTARAWSNPAGTVLIANIVGHQIDVVGHGRFVELPGARPANPSSIAW